MFSSFLIKNLIDHKQQAVIEKFNLCEDNLSGLLKWIGQIEQKIASVGGPKEYIDELRNQINLLKVSLPNLFCLWIRQLIRFFLKTAN